MDQTQQKLEKDMKKAVKMRDKLNLRVSALTTKNSERFERIQLQYAIKLMENNKRAENFIKK